MHVCIIIAVLDAAGLWTVCSLPPPAGGGPTLHSAFTQQLIKVPSGSSLQRVEFNRLPFTYV